MGYTHYWHRKADGHEPIHLLARALGDMAEILRRSPVELAGPEGTRGTLPEMSERGLFFNGVEELSHEPFEFPVALEPGPWEMHTLPWVFHFCKTAEKPYDAVVVACLLAAKHHLGESIRIQSDGKWKREWLEGAKPGVLSGVRLYESVFPERSPVSCPLEHERWERGLSRS